MSETVNVRTELAALVASLGSQKAVAAAYKVDPSYLSDVLKGRRPPSDRFLRKIGLRRIVVREAKP